MSEGGFEEKPIKKDLEKRNHIAPSSLDIVDRIPASSNQQSSLLDGNSSPPIDPNYELNNPLEKVGQGLENLQTRQDLGSFSQLVCPNNDAALYASLDASTPAQSILD